MNKIPDHVHYSLIYSESCVSFVIIVQFEFTWMRWPLALFNNNMTILCMLVFLLLIVKEERVHSMTIQSIRKAA